MRKSFIFTLMAGFIAVLSTASQPVLAAQSACQGPNCTTGPVDLNFQVVIPPLIHLRIGSPGTTVNTLLFDMTSNPQDVGNQSPQTGSGGDLGTSEVSVRVIANGGTATSIQVDTAVTAGPLGGIGCTGPGSCNPATDDIAWDQITVTGNGCTVAPPALVNGGGNFATYNATAGVVNEACSWTYRYANDTIPVNGTYFGTVTYTATVTP